MPPWAASAPTTSDEIDAQLPQGMAPAPMGLYDAAKAAWDDGRANQQLGARESALQAAYRARNDRIEALTGQAVPAGETTYDNRTGERVNDLGSDAYEAGVEQLRAKFPDQMADVPTGAAVRAGVDARLNALAARGQVAAQQHPIATFLGGSAAQLTDPINVGAGFLTGGVGEGAPIATRMLMQSGIWGGLAAGEAPFKAAEAHAAGGPAYGLSEALGDIGGGLLAGPIFEGGAAVLGRLARPLLDRAGLLLRTPGAEAERGAVDLLDQAALTHAAVGRMRAGGDFDAGVASLDRAAPMPPIEPSRELGDLFGETSPPPGPAAMTAAPLAGSPEGAALYGSAEYRGRQIYAGQFDPAALATDPATFQYKSGGDAAGVTERLKGVQAWDPTSSGKVIVYQGEDGGLTIADGHQRLGLANRLADKGFEPALDGYMFRAADGWSARDVRVIAALKNIREGQGNPLDAAKVFRDAPGAINDDSLPVSGDFMRQAKGLARLSPDAFGAVVNKVIPERYGAIIGELAGDRPDLHEGMVRLIKAGDPANLDEAHALVQEALQDEWIKGQGAQGDLFGESPAQSVAIGRAKLRAWLLKNLRGDSRLYAQLTRHADAIEAGGNVLARDANEASLAVTNVALENIAKLGMRAGELGDAMNGAARDIAEGGKVAEAGKAILARVKTAIRNGERLDEGRAGILDPAPPAAPAEKAAGLFDEPGGAGQAAQISPKPEDAALEAPTRAEAMGEAHPSLFDDIPSAEPESTALDHLKACTA